MRLELERFFAALRFFTRLPVPAWVGHSQAQLDSAARYFPLVGILVGAIGAMATEAALLVLPLSIAVLIGMAATLLATGAFHEDGFADACDGFGGGWDKARVLAIMKDSRIGSYGAIGMGMMLLAKWNALVEIAGAFEPSYLAAAIVAGHAASRLASTALIYALEYVRENDWPPTPQPPPQGGGDGSSPAAPAPGTTLDFPLGRPGGEIMAKSKPLARKLTPGELAVAALCGIAPSLFLPWPESLLAITGAAMAAWLGGLYFVRRIGGYTGDCLGATQQAAELLFYVALLVRFD
ncbi:MAG: adenosylcobinamide-GDP ribazoletransferase [Rhodocyclaceae bacterium]|nr:adenosylcobinamide-GDP ribazoletransferase [Rhodocyclaceae bacterium]